MHLTDKHISWLLRTKAMSGGSNSAPDASAPTGSDQGNGTLTVPEITIVGDASQANAESSSDGTSTPGAALPIMAAATLGGSVTGTPVGPGGMPLDPSTVDNTPWTPLSGGSGTAGAGGNATAGGAATVGGGDATAAAGAAASDGAVATGTGAGVAAAGEGTVVTGTGASATSTGVAASAGAVAAGAVVVGGAIVVGAAFVSGGIERTENAPDPDDPESGHGVGGAPPQKAEANPNKPIPTAQDPQTGEPLYTPADGEYSPAIDPATGQPFQAPGAQDSGAAADPNVPSTGNNDPANLGRKKDDRDVPADDLDPSEGEGLNPDGSVRRKPGKHGQFRGRRSKRDNDEDFERVCNDLGLDDDQRARLHTAIGGRNLDYDGIMQTALTEFPDKRPPAQGE